MTRGRIRRIFAALMGIAMLVTMLPVSALAGTCPECGGETYQVTTTEYYYYTNNDGTHLMVEQEYLRDHCDNCDMDFSGGGPGESTEITEDCDTPYCQKCGYGECPHPEEYVTVSELNNNYHFEQYTEKQHMATYDIYDEYYCAYCEQIFYSELKEEGHTEPERHFFDYDTGVCYDCKYVQGTCPVCGDAFTSVTKEDTVKTGYGYGYHDCVTGEYEYDYCNSCDRLYSGTLVNETGSSVELCTLADNVCTVCGAAVREESIDCSHEWMSGTWVVDSYYEPYNDIYHTYGGVMMFKTECFHCGFTTECYVEDPDYSELEYHNFVDDICTECETENTCEHPEDEYCTDTEQDYAYSYTFHDEWMHADTYNEYELTL